MKIVIIGDGKVGHKLAVQLSEEDYDITLIDQNQGRLKESIDELDVFCIAGKGTDAAIQKQAGVSKADLVIACASEDEKNMLSCLIAKKLGNCQTIARTKKPQYNKTIGLLKDDLGLALVINSHISAAQEMARALKFPNAIQLDTFAKGKQYKPRPKLR